MISILPIVAPRNGAPHEAESPEAPFTVELPTEAAPVTVTCVQDAQGFAALRPQWNELLRASAAGNPFLTWEWLHTWWAHLGDPRRLRLIVVRSGEQLLAIAPLQLVRGSLPWFSRLELLGTGHAGSDYLDLIVRRGCERDSLSAIARYLTSRRLAARFVHLPPTSLAMRLADDLAATGWTATAADDGTCPVIPLADQTFDSYLATLGSSHRANVRRRLRALEARFALGFDRITGDAERRAALEALVGFHEWRWKERGGSTAFVTPKVRAFQAEATRLALEAGWLRMYVLRLDGTPAAVMYGFHYDGRFYFYQHGFDDRYRDQSVGLVLMGLTIRAAIDDGAREFDLLWGVEPYKFLWTRETRTLRRVDLFPLHLGGAIHRRAVDTRRNVRTFARRVLSLGASDGW